MVRQQKIADMGVALSGTLVASTWVIEMTSIIQLIASVIAAVAGIGAAWWQFERAIHARAQRKQDESKDEDS
jgi:hypothetical protein